MLDILLDYIVRAAWILLSIYSVVVFVRHIINRGLVRAIIILFTWRVIMPLLFVMSLTLVSVSLVFVQPTEVGVVISLVSSNGVRNRPFNAGLHWIIPVVEQVLIYPIYWQTYTMSSKPMEGEQPGDDSIRARTSDGQEVLLDCSVFFRIDSEQVVRVHIDWQDRYIKDLVRPLIRGLVRRQVSQFTVAEVNSSARKDLEATLDQELKDQLSNKGLILDQFLLRDITFSPEYAASIENKQVALEGEVQKEYEAEQLRQLARGEADAFEIRAQGRAKAMIIEAEARAKAFELVGEALKTNPKLLINEYIQKLSPNIKVMLLPNDTPLILPLPELEEANDTLPLQSTISTSQQLSSTQPITSSLPAPYSTAIP
jgi:regulator of protease activity HflC (stomatin/prohibitin superfamily)